MPPRTRAMGMRKRAETVAARAVPCEDVPLQLLPKQTWRQNLRSLFFPYVHREALVVEGLPLPDEEPMLGDWFEHLTLLALIGLMISLALFDPFDRDVDSSLNKRMFIINSLLTFYFLLELVVRLVCLGFKDICTFLHMVDACIIMVSCASLVFQFNGVANRFYGVSVLRSVRILRPLRKLKGKDSMASLGIVINALVEVVSRITDATLLFLLFLMLFSVAAVSQFGRRIQTRCVNTIYDDPYIVGNITLLLNQSVGISPISWHGNQSTFLLRREHLMIHTKSNYVCGGHMETYLQSLLMSTNISVQTLSWNLKHLLPDQSFDKISCSPLQTCDDTKSKLLVGYHCPFGYSCETVGNPYHGYVGFDNMAMSMLTLFTAVTQQLWYEVSYMTASATDWLAVIFMAIVLILGGVLIVNLMIVLITVEFEKAKRVEDEKAKDLGSNSGASKFQSLVKQLVAQHRKLIEKNAEQAQAKVAEFIRADRWFFRMQLFLTEHFIEKQWFAYLSTFFIVSNVCVLAYVHEGMPEDHWQIILIFNWILNVIFSVETAIRVLSQPPKIYFKNFVNTFDFCIVILCWVDGAIPNWNFRYIRTLRVVRCIPILKVVPGIYQYVQFIGASIAGSPLVIVLLCLVIFVFGIMCMQLLGGHFCDLKFSSDEVLNPTMVDNTNPECPLRPRAHFDTFPQAIISSFQILTGDDWNLIMYDAMAARGASFAIFFVLYFYIGNFILLSILMGVMLSVHDSSNESEGEGQNQQVLTVPTDDEQSKQDVLLEEKEGDEEFLNATDPQEGTLSLLTSASQVIHSVTNLVGDVGPKAATQYVATDSFAAAMHKRSKFGECRQKASSFCTNIVEHPAFNRITAVVILTGSFSLAFRSEVDPPDVTRSVVLTIIDFAVIFYYVFETILNICAYGFVRKPESYLRRDRGNIFDFFLTLMGCVAMLDGVVDSRSRVFYHLFTFQALRPFSLVHKSSKMKIAMKSLITGFIELRYVVTAIFMMYFVYAVIGVLVLRGKMKSCQSPHPNQLLVETTPDGVRVPYHSLNRLNCTSLGGTWRNNGPNFDNALNALFALFQTSTLEMWAETMYKAMDFTADDAAPIVNANRWAAPYFMIFAFLSGFIVANIVTTVLTEMYNRIKRSSSSQKSLMMEREANGWLLTNRRILRCLPPSKRKQGSDNVVEEAAAIAFQVVGGDIHRTRKRLRRIVRSEKFILGSLFFILLNFFLMSIEHYPQSKEFERAIYIGNIFFAVVFFLEAMIKIFAETFRVYIASNWNRLDFFVAIVAVFGVATASVINPRASALVRSLRILRLARLLKGISHLGSLISKFVIALSSLGSVVALIFVVCFVFAILGQRLFGKLSWGPFHFDTINHSVNWSGFSDALDMLLRLSTGGNWLPLFFASRPNADDCDKNIGNCGPALPIPQLYYIIYIIVSTYILRNLLVAVMLDSFSTAADQRGLSKIDAEIFIANWKKFDPQFALHISPFDVLSLLRRIPAAAPIGFNAMLGKQRISMELRFLTLLRIRYLHFRRISFKTVVDVLCRMSYKGMPPEGRDFVNDIKERMAKEKQVYDKSLLVVEAQSIVSENSRERSPPKDGNEEVDALDAILEDPPSSKPSMTQEEKVSASMEFFVASSKDDEQLAKLNAAMLMIQVVIRRWCRKVRKARKQRESMLLGEDGKAKICAGIKGEDFDEDDDFDLFEVEELREEAERVRMAKIKKKRVKRFGDGGIDTDSAEDEPSLRPKPSTERFSEQEMTLLNHDI